MSPKIKKALHRVEDETKIWGTGTMGSGFAQFLSDLTLLITYIKRQQRRKRV